jgi:hypothetical protein
MSDIQNSGRAVIEGDDIVIRVAISALPVILEGIGGMFDDHYVVSDLKEFARDIVYELNREEEDGTTQIHRLFDKGIEEAIEQGSNAVDVYE